MEDQTCLDRNIYVINSLLNSHLEIAPLEEEPGLFLLPGMQVAGIFFLLAYVTLVSKVIPMPGVHAILTCAEILDTVRFVSQISHGPSPGLCRQLGAHSCALPVSSFYRL